MFTNPNDVPPPKQMIQSNPRAKENTVQDWADEAWADAQHVLNQGLKSFEGVTSDQLKIALSVLQLKTKIEAKTPPKDPNAELLTRVLSQGNMESMRSNEL
jgi:hypothetical protein